MLIHSNIIRSHCNYLTCLLNQLIMCRPTHKDFKRTCRDLIFILLNNFRCDSHRSQGQTNTACWPWFTALRISSLLSDRANKTQQSGDPHLSLKTMSSLSLHNNGCHYKLSYIIMPSTYKKRVLYHSWPMIVIQCWPSIKAKRHRALFSKY